MGPAAGKPQGLVAMRSRRRPAQKHPRGLGADLAGEQTGRLALYSVGSWEVQPGVKAEDIDEQEGWGKEMVLTKKLALSREGVQLAEI